QQSTWEAKSRSDAPYKARVYTVGCVAINNPLGKQNLAATHHTRRGFIPSGASLSTIYLGSKISQRRTLQSADLYTFLAMLNLTLYPRSLSSI
ncbi:hypothetical protein QUA56_18190, partial [Microcoleus sp. N3A4]|uniref:hypothetical protein n=1 Tax=Microcoleus sp. N3A4 TaxID=3055379 RepID=UPI002FD134FD